MVAWPGAWARPRAARGLCKRAVFQAVDGPPTNRPTHQLPAQSGGVCHTHRAHHTTFFSTLLDPISRNQWSNPPIPTNVDPILRKEYLKFDSPPLCLNSYLMWGITVSNTLLLLRTRKDKEDAERTFFQITRERAQDIQCKFGNHWKPGLSRSGRPIVQVTADLGP